MRKSVFLAHVKDAARQQGGTLPEYLKKTRELGFEGLECDYPDLEQDPQGFAAMLQEADLQIASVPYFCSFEKGVDAGKLRTVVEKTAAAGGKRILAIPGFLDEQYPDALEDMVKGLRILCEEAQKFGITVSLEDFDNQTSPCATGEGLRYFFRRVPALKFNLDTGNFLYMDEDVLEESRTMMDRIAHIHLKDRRNTPLYEGQQPRHSVSGRPMYDCPVGQGDIPMEKILAMAAAAGYEGFCSAEHYGARDQWDHMVQSAAWMKQHM